MGNIMTSKIKQTVILASISLVSMLDAGAAFGPLMCFFSSTTHTFPPWIDIAFAIAWATTLTRASATGNLFEEYKQCKTDRYTCLKLKRCRPGNKKVYPPVAL